VKHLVEVGNGLAVSFKPVPGNVPFFAPNRNLGSVLSPLPINRYPKYNPVFVGALPFGFAE
jgi:hypothetical protein